MHSDVAISVKNLTKTYRIFNHPGDRIKQALTFGQKQYHKEFTALKDVSFEIKKGDMVGIVGCNGSGKSTLLQLICGILKSTSGFVTASGRISALLELGAGFNPEFTGRENVYFQGAVLGITKEEMARRFDDIAAFADIGEFIEQPVRVYSSGMYLRLAFATAVHVDADILVVDEALSVGDASFRSRCFRRIGELRESGCTILFVSHELDQIVKFCDYAILLDDGHVLATGYPIQIVGYLKDLLNTDIAIREKLRHKLRNEIFFTTDIKKLSSPVPISSDVPQSTLEFFDPKLCSLAQISYQPNGALIEQVNIHSVTGQRINQLFSKHNYRCLFFTRFTKDAENVRFAFLIESAGGMGLGGAYSTPTSTDGIPFVCAGTSAEIYFKFDCILNPGNYSLSVSAFASLGGVEFMLHGIKNAVIFRVVAHHSEERISHIDFGCQSNVLIIDAPGQIY
jgi:lipopolysaccharide transport system ATP-binding protein